MNVLEHNVGVERPDLRERVFAGGSGSNHIVAELRQLLHQVQRNVALVFENNDTLLAHGSTTALRAKLVDCVRCTVNSASTCSSINCSSSVVLLRRFTAGNRALVH